MTPTDAAHKTLIVDIDALAADREGCFVDARVLDLQPVEFGIFGVCNNGISRLAVGCAVVALAERQCAFCFAEDRHIAVGELQSGAQPRGGGVCIFGKAGLIDIFVAQASVEKRCPNRVCRLCRCLQGCEYADEAYGQLWTGKVRK